MPSRSLSDLHPDLQPLCEQFLESCTINSINAFVVQTYRSKAEQDALYAQGRTTPGKVVTHATGGHSKHEFTLPDGTPASKAFDFMIKDSGGHLISDGTDPAYYQAGQLGKSLGLIWGGDWAQPKTDYDHLQLDDTGSES